MLDNLYKNIGSKIKTLAKWGFIVEAIGAIVTGIVLLFDEFILVGLLTMICGPVVAWVGSWILYAFGELVEDAHSIRNDAKIVNIDKNVQLLATPMIREADEKVRREAEEKAKREAVEKAAREAEAQAKREAKEAAKREAREQAKREAAEKNNPNLPKKEKTLSEKLEYALRYSTDAGMISYLKDIKDEAVQGILQSPADTVRQQIADLLKKSQ